MIDIGLYIHVPFCVRKCGYCDFYSIVPNDDQVEPLVDALLAELERALVPPSETCAPFARMFSEKSRAVVAAHENAVAQGDRAVRVETVFVGGGTPTCLPLQALRRLLTGLDRALGANRPSEFTIEANPGTLTREKAALIRDHGVTRISVGAQSFHQPELAVLERIHGPDDIAATAAIIHQMGFPHFNLDLIFGIPGQTRQTWLASLRRAVELGPDHLACYGLTYEPGTPLGKLLDAGQVVPMDESTEADLYLTAIDFLDGAGLEQYEISNFARGGSRADLDSGQTGACLHNLRYWRNQPTLGIGPAAASFMDGRRWRNLPDVAEYVRRIQTGESLAVDVEMLDPLARAGETAMLGLRLNQGIRRSLFLAQTGFDPHILFAGPIARHAGAGRLEVNQERIALTRSGRLVADAVVTDFLLPQPPDLGPATCESDP